MNRFLLKSSLLASALTLTAFCHAASASGGSSRTTEIDAFEQALDLISTGRHAAAYGRLIKLADAGHARSARLALVMVTHGKNMYGSEWAATAAQQQRWNTLVLNQMRSFVPLEGLPSGE